MADIKFLKNNVYKSTKQNNLVWDMNAKTQRNCLNNQKVREGESILLTLRCANFWLSFY